MKMRFGLGLAIASAILLAAAPLRAEKKTPDLNSLYLEDGTPLLYGLQELKDSCVENQRRVQSEYLKEKRRTNRSLGSLDARWQDQANALRNLQKKLTKDLKRVELDCEKERRKMIGEARRREDILPSTRVAKRRPPPPEEKPAPKQKPAKPEIKEARLWPVLKNFRVHGSLRQDSAYRRNDPHQFSKNRSMLILEQTTRFNDDVRFKVSERGFFDTAVRHKNQENKNVPGYEKNDLEDDLSVRDAYMDYSKGNFDMRLGKQQIVWGEAVSVFVADVVNGKDYREFILPDFDQIRRPQWSALLSQSMGDLHVEGVASVPEFNQLPKKSAEFAFPTTATPAGITVISSDAAKPDTNFSNADYGGRLSYLFGGWDTGLFYLYTWDKSPVMFQSVRGSTVNVRPEYRRQNVGGFTFSKDILDAIVKGEFAVRDKVHVQTTDPADADGIVETKSYEYVFGIDRQVLKYWDVNLQIYQRFLTDDLPVLTPTEEKRRTLLSAWIKGSFNDGRFEPEYLIVGEPSRQDRMHRPKVTMRLTDWLLFKIGADIFEGKKTAGVFAVYDNQDRYYGEMEVRF